MCNFNNSAFGTLSLSQLSNTNANASAYATFEAGENYNAMIVAVVPAMNEYQGTTKRGMVPVLAVEDTAGLQEYKAASFISLEGNIFFAKAACAKFYQGLLKTQAENGALQAAIKAAGLDTLEALKGYSCTVTMSMRTGTTGKTFANIEKVSGTTSRLKGLSKLSPDIGCLDLKKVCSKFLTLDTAHAIIMDGVTLADSTDAPVVESAITENEPVV